MLTDCKTFDEYCKTYLGILFDIKSLYATIFNWEFVKKIDNSNSYLSHHSKFIEEIHLQSDIEDTISSKS